MVMRTSAKRVFVGSIPTQCSRNKLVPLSTIGIVYQPLNLVDVGSSPTGAAKIMRDDTRFYRRARSKYQCS